MDGTDFLPSYRAPQQAAEYCRGGHGPALVHAHVVRPYSHSLSDDERHYKTAAERQLESQRDPVLHFPQLLIQEGILDRRMLQDITHEVDPEIHQATEQALRDTPPDPGRRDARDSYPETIDPTAPAFAAHAEPRGAPMTMVDLINATLREEMRRNPRHPGVRRRRAADCGRSANLGKVKGKGGVFKSDPRPGNRIPPRAAASNTPLAGKGPSWGAPSVWRPAA